MRRCATLVARSCAITASAATSGLLSTNTLLQALIVHVKVAHWLFLDTRWCSLEFGLERLVVDLELCFDTLFLSHQVLHGECAKMLALNLLVIDAELLASRLVLQFCLHFEPVGKWAISGRRSTSNRHSCDWVKVRRLLAERRFTRNLRLILAHLRRRLVHAGVVLSSSEELGHGARHDLVQNFELHFSTYLY